MRDRVASSQGDAQTAPPNLGPPEFLQEGLKQLTAIMNTFETSFTSAGSKEAQFEPILVEAFDPFMKGCESMAEDLVSPEATIFAINCFLAARNTLVPFDFTNERLSEIQDSIDEYASTIIEYQYSQFRNNSALHPLLKALTTITDSKEALLSIRSLDEFQPEALVQSGQILDDFLPSALMDAMENLKNLQSSKLARDIVEEAADRFCDDFELVEEKLISSDEIWEQESREDALAASQPLRAFFPRTSGEIRVLLS